MTRKLLRLLIFHVTSESNKEKIERNGLLARHRLAEKDFEDRSDEQLRSNLNNKIRGKSYSWSEDSETIEFPPHKCVPFHFINPLYENVYPADVKRWKRENNDNYACVLKEDSLDDYEHIICIGHWHYDHLKSIFLDSFSVFKKYLRRPPENISRTVEKYFSEDIPNILQGNINKQLLGKNLNKYRFLMHSTIFIAEQVSAKDLEFVPLNDMENEADDEKIYLEYDQGS